MPKKDDNIPKPSYSGKKTLTKIIQEHWLFTIFCIISITASTTWVLSNNIQIQPRDFTIQQQRNEISDLTNTLQRRDSDIKDKDPLIKEQNKEIEKFKNIIANCTKIVINITAPKGGDPVPGFSVVTGTISGELPEGQYMWVVSDIDSVPGLWWPQAGPVKPQYGLWNANVWLGSNENVGRVFTIAVISMNESDNQIFVKYREEGNKTGDFPAIKLPDSATIMNSIKVTRIKDMNS